MAHPSSGTVCENASGFTGFRFPPEVISLAVRWYLRAESARPAIRFGTSWCPAAPSSKSSPYRTLAGEVYARGLSVNLHFAHVGRRHKGR